MSHLKAISAVFILLIILAVPFSRYWAFLTSGMKPPPSTQILTAMENLGVADFSLPSVSGDPIKLSDIKGRIVVVNFWASWCAPCVKEFPSLKRLVEKRKGKIAVVAISNDSQFDDLKSFLLAFGEIPSEFFVAWDKDRKVSERYGTQILPESFIIGPDRHLIRKVAGVDEWDAPMALQFFDEIIAAHGI
jgi:thiol-disulfide isomerase/thioredoxin